MNENYPITPPPELVQQWYDEARDASLSTPKIEKMVAARAAQWGADQELDAVIEWMKRMGYWGEDGMAIPALRAARRPKPPSLKEQALEMLENTWKGGHISNNAAQTIRRALEALPE